MRPGSPHRCLLSYSFIWSPSPFILIPKKTMTEDEEKKLNNMKTRCCSQPTVMLHCSEGRIVNGSRACYGQFPWQVHRFILFSMASLSWQILCFVLNTSMVSSPCTDCYQSINTLALGVKSIKALVLGVGAKNLLLWFLIDSPMRGSSCQ